MWRSDQCKSRLGCRVCVFGAVIDVVVMMWRRRTCRALRDLKVPFLHRPSDRGSAFASDQCRTFFVDGDLAIIVCVEKQSDCDEE